MGPWGPGRNPENSPVPFYGLAHGRGFRTAAGGGPPAGPPNPSLERTLERLFPRQRASPPKLVFPAHAPAGDSQPVVISTPPPRSGPPAGTALRAQKPRGPWPVARPPCVFSFPRRRAPPRGPALHGPRAGFLSTHRPRLAPRPLAPAAPRGGAGPIGLVKEGASTPTPLICPFLLPCNVSYGPALNESAVQTNPAPTARPRPVQPPAAVSARYLRPWAVGLVARGAGGHHGNPGGPGPPFPLRGRRNFSQFPRPPGAEGAAKAEKSFPAPSPGAGGTDAAICFCLKARKGPLRTLLRGPRKGGRPRGRWALRLALFPRANASSGQGAGSHGPARSRRAPFSGTPASGGVKRVRRRRDLGGPPQRLQKSRGRGKAGGPGAPRAGGARRGLNLFFSSSRPEEGK